MLIVKREQYPLVVLFLIISFALSPMYLFSSGGFQIVDVAIILLSLAIFRSLDIAEYKAGVYLLAPFIPFVLWATAINTFYAIVTGFEPGYVTSLIQIVYGFYILVLFSIVFKRILSTEKGIFYIYSALLISCITPWLLKISSESSRNALSFNNPNQLAYYSILILFMLISIIFINNKDKTRLYFILNIIIILVANIFTVISISRAGFVCTAILDLYLLFILTKKYKYIFLAALVLPILLIVIYMNNKIDLIQLKYVENINTRFSKKGVLNTTDLYHRTFGFFGYKDDITVFIGNGGQDWDKTQNIDVRYMYMKEVHNTVLGILNNYGFIGFFIFLGASIIYINRLGGSINKYLLLTPIILYNMSHYGLRFRFMWVALALFSVISFYKDDINDTSVNFNT